MSQNSKLIGVHNSIQYFVRESDGIDYYYSLKSNKTAMSIQGFARMVQGKVETLANIATRLGILKSAKLLTHSGIQLTRFVLEDDTPMLLKKIVDSRMKVEVREKASHILYSRYNIFYCIKQKAIKYKESIETKCLKSYQKLLYETEFILEYPTPSGNADFFMSGGGLKNSCIGEVKKIEKWKHALGQIIAYRYWCEPNIDSHVILICDKDIIEPKIANLLQIFHSQKVGVTLWNFVSDNFFVPPIQHTIK